MLNFCITMGLSRIRGHGKAVFVQIKNDSTGKYDNELSFSCMSQAVAALLIKDAVTQTELMMLRDIAKEAISSVSDLLLGENNESFQS